MSVVLRCPTCGTTQEKVGECEACSEGEVRYFCANHHEGIWLEGPVCHFCSRRFGDPPKKPAAAPATPRAPAGAPDFRPPVRRRAPARPPEPDFSGRPPRRPEHEEPLEPEVLPRTKSLAEMLTEAIEEGSRARRRDEVVEIPWPEPRAHRPGVPVLGCLGRVVGLVFLLIAIFVVFLLLLFRGFFIG